MGYYEELSREENNFLDELLGIKTSFAGVDDALDTLEELSDTQPVFPKNICLRPPVKNPESSK